MGARTRTQVPGWRWRRNPLRRRSDVVEGWAALVMAVLLLVGAPLAGVLVGAWGYGEAHSVAQRLRAELHMVRARVTGPVPQVSGTAPGGREQTYRVSVRWTPPGEPPRTTTAPIAAGTRTGATVTVWLDPSGVGMSAPPTSAMVWQQALSAGLCGAGGTAGTALVGYALFRRTALKHRLTEWERDWARTEPEWTHGGT